MAYSNIVLQPALHVWTCLNVYIVKYTFPWNQDLAINAPQVIPQISSLLYQRITLITNVLLPKTVLKCCQSSVNKRTFCPGVVCINYSRF